MNIYFRVSVRQGRNLISKKKIEQTLFELIRSSNKDKKEENNK